MGKCPNIKLFCETGTIEPSKQLLKAYSLHRDQKLYKTKMDSIFAESKQ